MQGGRAVALPGVTAHQRAPRLLIERVEAKELPRRLDGIAEGALVFKSRHQLAEHLAGALPEPLAIRLDPFVGAVWQQVALIERRGVLECLQIPGESPVRSGSDRTYHPPSRHTT